MLQCVFLSFGNGFQINMSFIVFIGFFKCIPEFHIRMRNKKFFVSKLNKCTVCEFYRINSILFEKRLWHFNKVTGFASKNGCY